MKKTLLAALLISTLAIALPASAQGQFDRVRWQVPIAFATTLTALGDTAPWVADRLREASGGRVDLRIFEPGALIPALGVFENVSAGNVPAGYSWMGYEWGKLPASALFGATPFGLESAQFVAWMNFRGGDELLKELYKPHNVHPILCGTISPETAGWFRKEITSVADFKGMKFRAAGVGGEIMAEFGKSVTLLPAGELFMALQTGVLDGTEFSLPTIDEQLGFERVAKFLALPGWHQPSTNQYLYVNLGEWNKLNRQTQALIETTCMAANMRALAWAEALQGAVLKRFEERGVTRIVYSEEILRAFKAATDRVMERRSRADPMFARVYKSMLAFQAENAPWLRYGYLPRDFGAGR